MSVQQNLAVPCHTSDKVTYRANTFIVQVQVDPDEYYYYPVKVDSSDSNGTNLRRFSKTPPVLQDGLLCYQKRFYSVTVADIQRARFLLSNEVTLHAEPASPSPITIPNSGDDEPRVVPDVILEVGAAADAIVEEQTRALLHDQAGEEVWLEDSQPG